MAQNKWMTDAVNRMRKMKKEDYLVLVLVGILFVIIALPTENVKEMSNQKTLQIETGEKTTENMEKNEDNTRYQIEGLYSESFYYVQNLEQKVEEILKNVSGIGKVAVMITVSNMGEEVVEKDTEAMQNHTEEEDAVGGKRVLEEKSQKYETVFTVDEGGNNVPYVVQTRMPSVTGVVVIAQGAGDRQVKQNIIDALEVLFNISEQKIKVIKMKS